MQKVTKHNPTIKTPAKGIAKNKASGKMSAGNRIKDDFSKKKAAETSGAEESGVKKKRMTKVESIKKP
jgi:hypothetical protein